jgi:hypothetical protein
MTLTILIILLFGDAYGGWDVPWHSYLFFSLMIIYFEVRDFVRWRKNKKAEGNREEIMRKHRFKRAKRLRKEKQEKRLSHD